MNRTKKIIFDAAIKSFSRNGFHKSTMDEIAETAGVAKGTLYYHFKSKEEIFKFIIHEGLREIENEIRERTEQVENPVDKLRMLCQVQLELVLKYLEFFKTVLSQMWGDEKRQSELRCAFAIYFKHIESYLKEAANAGIIADDNIEILAYNFFGVMASTLCYKLAHDDVNVTELVDTLINFLMRGIAKNQNQTD
jgi:TetR/AcrR family transcriptional regulator